jgi:tellurium resistance protein TerD
MAVSLAKGGNVSLSRTTPNLRKILIGLGWDARSTDGASFDLDASIFMLQENGLVRRDEDFIFYGNLASLCQSIQHNGDNRTGAGEGDDESIIVELEKIPLGANRLAVTVTIHEAEGRRQNFGQVSGAFIRVVNMDNDIELVRFDLTEDYGPETAMIFGEIYRYQEEWKFKAIGQGYSGGLKAMCSRYGVDVE